MAKKKAKSLVSKNKVKNKPVKKKIKTSKENLIVNSTQSVPDFEIVVLHEDYKPIVLEDSIEVFAICPLLSMNSLQETLLNHRQSFVFKCGIKINLPKGFRIRCELSKNFSNNGLFINSSYLNQENELFIEVINLGRQSPVSVKHRDILAKVFFEPIYYLKGIKWK